LRGFALPAPARTTVTVGRAAIQPTVPFVGGEVVPVASQYGAVFASSRAAGFAIAV